MKIRSYKEYQEKIKPLEMLEKFNKLLKKNKPRDKELYVPSCQKFSEIKGMEIPIIVAKSMYDGNFYEIPVSEIIRIEDLREIDFKTIDYRACRYLNKLPKGSNDS